MISTLIELCAVAILSRYVEETDPEEQAVDNGTSLFEFVRHNRSFMMIIVGVILMFYFHCILTSFTINIVNDLGGNAGTVGYMNGFMAAMEIPVALFYSRMFIDHGKALKIAAISTSIKAIAVALAFNIPLLFMSLILQAPSFALYITSILASIIGGYLFDRISVRNNLYISTVVTIIGSLLILYTLQKNKKNVQDSN
ncbi:MAG: hypothetical protein K6A70_02810 [Erysipelotrichaceae bacterium]|nr:hypothetical protein [Erysipelotrichaceae bacterium]